MKKFDKTKIRYDHNYNPDPDLKDRGHIRFPDLNTKKRIGQYRTPSPPPRPDDPNELREENRRRRQGLRPAGPPCKPGYPEDRDFQRNFDWERALQDEDGRQYGEFGGPTPKRKATSPEPEKPKKKKREETNRFTSRDTRGGATSAATLSATEEEEDHRSINLSNLILK